jgi:predicted transcriptional regulator
MVADKVDREEAAEIKATGRRILIRHRRLREAVAMLKRERERLNLSLDEVGRRSGIGKANLSRLENSATANPTLDTLARYAEAIGKDVLVTVGDLKTP